MKEKVKERGLVSLIRYIFINPIEMLTRAIPYSPLRILIIRVLGTKVDFSTMMYSVKFINADIGRFGNLNIGEHAHINDGVMIDLKGKVKITDYVTIAPRVMIFSHQSVQPMSPLATYYPEKTGEVVIGKGVYIGAGAIVLSGVNIGEMAVIGAGSIVKKDVSPRTVVAGVPSKPLKNVFKNKH